MNVLEIIITVLIIVILIFFITGLIILWVKYVSEKERKRKIVFMYSNKIKELLEINYRYNFANIYKKNHTISFKCNSKRQLDYMSFEDVIISCFSDNFDNIKNDIELVMKNRVMYNYYLDEINELKSNVSQEILIQNNINEYDFNKIEKEIFYKNIKKNNFDITCNVEIYYITPKGRNYYSKKRKLFSSDIISIYGYSKRRDELKSSAYYERLKMNDSLRYNIFKRDNFRCQICGATQADGVKLHVDHILPVSKGGKTEWNNLRTLCERCNLGKGDKIE